MASHAGRGATLGNGIALVLLVLALLVAVTQQGTGAPVQTTASIAGRVRIQPDNCTIGGGQIEVSDTSGPFFNGAMTSANTDCGKPFTQPAQPPFGGMPGTADPADAGQAPSFTAADVTKGRFAMLPLYPTYPEYLGSDARQQQARYAADPDDFLGVVDAPSSGPASRQPAAEPDADPERGLAARPTFHARTLISTAGAIVASSPRP